MARKILFTAITLLFTLLILSPSNGASSPIENIVVLMLENRAFDHMCGYLKQSLNNEIRGLTGKESNPINPYDPNSERVYVNKNAHYSVADPGHSIDATTQQIFGGANRTNIVPPPMDGFVASELKVIGASPPGSVVMSMFTDQTVPIISTLAKEFGLFDAWYASVPGPTEVNRCYIHSATSHGMGTNDVPLLIEGLPEDTIYQRLDEVGKQWNVYMEEVTSTWFFTKMRSTKYYERFRDFSTFENDAKHGRLAHFNFIEPRYFSVLSYPANDQHPDHSVAEGEKLMKRVYEALRAGPQWNKTALLITYDEHGGFFDHYPTPLNIPNPDGRDSTKPPFNFERIGIRVPALIISPWVKKGRVIHEPAANVRPYPDSQYEHSSLPATVKKIFGTKSFLTKRDEWAGTFENIFTELSAPRTDCPMKLPDAPVKLHKSTTNEHNQKINDLQKSWIQLAQILTKDFETDVTTLSTQEEGAMYVRSQVKKFLRRGE